MKKLSPIYKNIITKKIGHNKEIERISKSTINHNKYDTLKEIFNGNGFAFNKDVLITTKDKIYDTSLISKNSNYVLTIDNDMINIKDIIDITIK